MFGAASDPYSLSDYPSLPPADSLAEDISGITFSFEYPSGLIKSNCSCSDNFIFSWCIVSSTLTLNYCILIFQYYYSSLLIDINVIGGVC
jgi:hypothetical protein